MTKSFEDRFFDEISKRFDKQDARADKQDRLLSDILKQAQYTNGRVTGLEDREKTATNRLKALEVRKGRKFNIPTNVLYLLAVAAVIILVIIAKFMGIPVGGVL